MFIENNILESISPEDIVNNALIIPEGVTTILHTAFNRYTIEEANLMDSIKYITVPRTIVHIDYGTFDTCPYLTGLIIKNIEYVFNCNLFRKCAQLSYVQVGAYKYNILWLEGKHYHITSSTRIPSTEAEFEELAIYKLALLKPDEWELKYGNPSFYLTIPRIINTTSHIYGIGHTVEESIELLSMGGLNLSNIKQKYCNLSLDSKICIHDYKLICKEDWRLSSSISIEMWLLKIGRAINYFSSNTEIISIRSLITRMINSYSEQLSQLTEKNVLPNNDIQLDLNDLANILASKYAERTKQPTKKMGEKE